MSDIEKALLGRVEGGIFSFQGNSYKVLKVIKSGGRKPETILHSKFDELYGFGLPVQSVNNI